MKLNAFPRPFTGQAVFVALVLAGGVPAARATVVPNPLFADHAVLQQGTKVPVWGTADPGEAVSVEIAGRTVSTTASADGKWMVNLPPMKAGGPFKLTIAGKSKLTLTDILVGEVWIASGQSNMERQLGLRAGQQPIERWQDEAHTSGGKLGPDISTWHKPDIFMWLLHVNVR